MNTIKNNSSVTLLSNTKLNVYKKVLQEVCEIFNRAEQNRILTAKLKSSSAVTLMRF